MHEVADLSDRLATQRFTVVEDALVAEGIERAMLTRAALVDPIPLPANAVRRVEIRFVLVFVLIVVAR